MRDSLNQTMHEQVLAAGYIVTGLAKYPGDMDSTIVDSRAEADKIAQDAAQRGRVAGIYQLVEIHEPVTQSSRITLKN